VSFQRKGKILGDQEIGMNRERFTEEKADKVVPHEDEEFLD
jgi:hypothetical protein